MQRTKYPELTMLARFLYFKIQKAIEEGNVDWMPAAETAQTEEAVAEQYPDDAGSTGQEIRSYHIIKL